MFIFFLVHFFLFYFAFLVLHRIAHSSPFIGYWLPEHSGNFSNKSDGVNNWHDYF